MGKILLLLLLLTAWPVTSAAEEPLDPIVILDAGHGGEDGGSSSADGTLESEVNLIITHRLEATLAFLGKSTKMTRTGEGGVASPEAKTLREKKRSDLQNRVAFINAVPRAHLISIHQNSLPPHPEVHGAQIFYNAVPGAKELAEAVQAMLNQTINPGNEKACKPIGQVYLMQKTVHPAILVECGFLSNSREASRLRDPTYQKQLAAVIAAGYLKYHKTRESYENKDDLLLYRVRQ